MEKEEDLPVGLREGLDQVLGWVKFEVDHFRRLNRTVSVLNEINAFAEKGASRNPFWAFIRTIIRGGVDAGQIQDYRQKLQQSLGKFGVSIQGAERCRELTFCYSFSQTLISRSRCKSWLRSRERSLSCSKIRIT